MYLIFGNVLTDFRWKDFLRDKGFDEVTAGRIAKVSIRNPVWNESDCGEWDWKRLIQELKMKGFRVYCLSNFSYTIYMDCIDSLDFLPCMDGGILSYRVRTIKPGAEIYRLLLSQYNLKAEECVFLDDTLFNAEKAKRLGFHGIYFKTKELAEEELQKLGVS